MFTLSKTLETALDSPEYVTIQYDQGIPVAINGQSMGPVDGLTKLNAIGAAHGIGQVDMVENRLVGIKSRGVYETPGGTILYETHRMLEQLVLDRDTALLKQKMAIEYAQMVYDGRWFCPAKSALDAFVDSTQTSVTGTVRVKLYKGNIVPAGVTADQSLYMHDLASFSDTELYDQKDATGFIRVFGLPMKVNGMVNRS